MSDRGSNAVMVIEDLVQQFVDAVSELELQHSADALVGLYRDDATAGNVLHPESRPGHDGVREFWDGYRRAFDDLRSTFRLIIVGACGAALEWGTEASGPNGAVQYAGVTMLEIEGDRIRRSMAYYDPSRLGAQLSP